MVKKLGHNVVLAGVLALAGFSAYAETTEVEVNMEVLLAPTRGYDDNDNIQVVGHGYLPNSCYSLGRYDVAKDASGKKMQIRQFSAKSLDGICSDEAQLPAHMKAPVPFTTEYNLGQLPAGDYDFNFASSVPSSSGSLSINVGAATALTVDSLPYAAVSTTMVPDIISSMDKVKVSLSGVTTSSCTQVDPNVGVQKSGDVYVLFPVIKVKPNVLCMQIMRPFLIEVDLGKMKPGHYLVHTRSMNGRALNKVINITR